MTSLILCPNDNDSVKQAGEKRKKKKTHIVDPKILMKILFHYPRLILKS